MADAVDRLTQSNVTWWALFAMSMVLLAYIIGSHIHPTRTVVTSPPSVAVDPPGGPCTPDRWELACSRWREQGWPCIVGEGPGALSVEAITIPDVRGAHRAGAIGLAAFACGEDDPAPEHELGHAFGLPDCPGCPIGDVMGTPHTRAGMRVPRRVTAEGE